MNDDKVNRQRMAVETLLYLQVAILLRELLWQFCSPLTMGFQCAPQDRLDRIGHPQEAEIGRVRPIHRGFTVHSEQLVGRHREPVPLSGVTKLGVNLPKPGVVRGGLQRTFHRQLFSQANAAERDAENFLSLKAHSSGPLMIQTGHSGTVVGALTGAKLGRGPSITLPMEAGEVRVLR
jgi:hypothetical protein